MANLEIIFYIPNRFTTFFLKRYTALSFKTDMTARFCACNACRYFFSKLRIYRIYQIAASAKPAISDGGFAAWLTPFAGDEVNPRMAD